MNLLPVRMATALALKSYPVKRQLKVPGGTLDVQKAVTFFLIICELEREEEFLLYEDALLIILGMGAVCTFKLSSGYHRVVYQTLITNRVIEVEMALRKSPLFEVVDEENFIDNWVRHLSLNMNEYSEYRRKLCKLYLKLRSLGTNLSKDEKERLYERWLECEKRKAYILECKAEWAGMGAKRPFPSLFRDDRDDLAQRCIKKFLLDNRLFPELQPPTCPRKKTTTELEGPTMILLKDKKTGRDPPSTYMGLFPPWQLTVMLSSLAVCLTFPVWGPVEGLPFSAGQGDRRLEEGADFLSWGLEGLKTLGESLVASLR